MRIAGIFSALLTYYRDFYLFQFQYQDRIRLKVFPDWMKRLEVFRSRNHSMSISTVLDSIKKARKEVYREIWEE